MPNSALPNGAKYKAETARIVFTAGVAVWIALAGFCGVYLVAELTR